MKAVIKRFIKLFIDYRIENDVKRYTLKHTKIGVSYSLKKIYEKKWGHCKVEQQKIVLDNYMGKSYGCNPKYVTEELLRRNCNLDIVWTVKNAKQHEGEMPKGVRLVEYGSPEAFLAYATAKVWVGNYHLVAYFNKGLMKKPEQTYIQMWHGSFGIKKIENDCKNLTQDKNWTVLAEKNSRYTDYWISNSKFETEVYRQAFWDVDRVLEYGHPRNDIFFGEGLAKAKNAVETYIRRKNCKLLIYVPTFRDDSMEWEQQVDYRQLKESLEQRFSGEWLILVRMHPRMKAYASKLIPENDYCIDVTDYPDIQELLAASDVAITDYSSAIFDFLLTGRPAFIYAPDYLEYKQMRGLYYPLEETPFSIANDNQKLAKNIAAFDEAVYKEKVFTFLEGKGAVEDGNAAKRVADLIIECVEKKRE